MMGKGTAQGATDTQTAQTERYRAVCGGLCARSDRGKAKQGTGQDGEMVGAARNGEQGRITYRAKEHCCHAAL